LAPEPRASIEEVLEALDGILAMPSANAGQAGSPVAAPVPPAAPPLPPIPTPAAGTAPERADVLEALRPRAGSRSTWPGVVVGAAVRGELWARTAAIGPNA